MTSTLKTKVALLIVIIALILSGTSITISNRIISGLIDTNYRNKAEALAKTVALMVDNNAAAKLKSEILDVYNNTPVKVTSEDWGSDAFNDYIARYSVIQKGRVYKSLYNTLQFALIANKVDSVYLYIVDPKLANCIYMLDASDEPCPVGCIDPLGWNPVNLRLIDHPEIGFPSFITKTEEYGWLVTAGTPLYDKDGDVLCYAMVDISMDEVKRMQRMFTLYLIIILAGLTLIICIIAILVVNYTVCKPISRISTAAVQYCAESSDAERDGFSKLNIHTGDEIEELADSMKRMEHDLNAHIRTILNTMHELTLTRKKADEMSELAHKDALTGLRNKAAYDKEIIRIKEGLLEGKTKFGIAMIDLNFLKKTNDNYGHDKGNISLKNLSKLICDIFDHSPVFRIGGDEFVVILEQADFRNAYELAMCFENMISNLQKDVNLAPWERISAAIGVAVYDRSQDQSVDNVFKRADQIMYENKKKMKAERQDY